MLKLSKAELKRKKQRLFELERLQFRRDEPHWQIRENLRLEIIEAEKEHEAERKAKLRGNRR